MDKILTWLRAAYPQRVTQTQVMQKFRIRKRDILDIEATLVARNLIQVDPYPYRKDVPGTKIEWTVPSKNKPKPLSSVQKEDDFHYGNEENSGQSQPRPQANNGHRIRVAFPGYADSDANSNSDSENQAN